MPHYENDALLKKIEKFLEATGISATVFGLRSIGDANLVFQMREGREVMPSTARRILDFMKKARRGKT